MPKKYKHAADFTFDGKRYKVRADSEQKLYEKMARKKLELEQGRVLLNRSTLVRDWTKQALSTYKASVGEDYLSQMEMRINKHILSEIGDFPLKSVKPIHCQAIMNKQIGKSKSHITKVYQELHFIFETAVKNKLIFENPADDLTIPKGVKGTRQSITEAERSALLRAVSLDSSYVLFLLMLQCGCRPAEAIRAQGLDIQQIDGVNMLHIRGTKTENADRLVPIPDDLYERICETGPFEFIAPNAAGRMHTESSYNRIVSRLKRDMNIQMGCKMYRNKLTRPYPLRESFVPYDLRHTYCTDLARKGVDVRVAQKLMGHANISITANIYTNLTDTDIITGAAELIGATRKGVVAGVAPNTPF